MRLSEHCEICGAFAACFNVKDLDICEKCLKKLDKRDDHSKIKVLQPCDNCDSWLYGVKDNIRHF